MAHHEQSNYKLTDDKVIEQIFKWSRVDGKTDKEIVNLIKKHFGITVGRTTVNNVLNGVHHQDVTTIYRHLEKPVNPNWSEKTTAEQRQWIIDCPKKWPSTKIQRLLKKKFGVELSDRRIRDIRKG